jgi:hypothetical protein
MYNIQNNGVLKRIETWHLIIPKHDNDGNAFSQQTIDSILQDITLTFPGFTLVNCAGCWEEGGRVYRDDNIEVLIDLIPSTADAATEFFARLKNDLQARLNQKKIYVTKESSKEEFITFDEFFEEIGIDPDSVGTEDNKRRTAVKFVQEIEFVLKRLSYETIALRRDFANHKIIWERRLCGMILRSELNDPFPPDMTVAAADQYDRMSRALPLKPCAIIGHYEFVSYALIIHAHRALVKVSLDEEQTDRSIQYLSQTREPLSTRRFIEEFTATVFTNFLVMREEGFLNSEIKMSVGSDGSLQHGSNRDGSIVFHSPAGIPDEVVQKEILRCLARACKMFEQGELDLIAVQQARAKNFYVLKRAVARSMLRGKQASKETSGTKDEN